MKTTNKSCEGCCKRETLMGCIFLGSLYRDKIKLSECPCCKCIVKVVCMEMCAQYYEFYLNKHALGERYEDEKRGVYRLQKQSEREVHTDD